MPLAGYAELHDDTLRLWGMTADMDYANARWIAQTASAADPFAAGWQLADALGLTIGVRA